MYDVWHTGPVPYSILTRWISRNKPPNLILMQSLHLKYTCGKRAVPYSASLYIPFSVLSIIILCPAPTNKTRKISQTGWRHFSLPSLKLVTLWVLPFKVTLPSLKLVTLCVLYPSKFYFKWFYCKHFNSMNFYSFCWFIFSVMTRLNKLLWKLIVSKGSCTYCTFVYILDTIQYT